jgi:transcription elongation factor Elf1
MTAYQFGYTIAEICNETRQEMRAVNPAESGDFMTEEKQLPITCPLCGRKNSFALEILVEGSTIVCPFCSVSLKLHGHMLEEIQTQIAKLKDGD